MNSNTEIDALKQAIPLWQVALTRLTGMRRRGAEMDFICPWHSDEDPSFQVYEKDGVWLGHCKGCGEGPMNVFQFLMKLDSIDFKEAVKRVKEFAEPGWQEKVKSVEEVFQNVVKKSEALVSVSLADFAPFEAALFESQRARDWLGSRGILPEYAAIAHLGYVDAPSPKVVYTDHDWYNNGWILFPEIRAGRIVAVKYRSVMGKKSPGKHPGFAQRKDMLTSVLYGQETLGSENEICPVDDAFIVEGEPDRLIMMQAGFTAVSLPSANFTPSIEMRQALMRPAVRYCAGDTDEAGMKCMDKLCKELGGINPLTTTTFHLVWPKPFKDANETFLKGCNSDIEKFRDLIFRLMDESRSRRLPGIEDLKSGMLNTNSTPPKDSPDRLFFPWHNIDEWVSILPGEVMFMFATETKMGKALKNGTPVLTPKGYCPIENLKVGDQVVGKNGKPTEVLGVFPQGINPIYDVLFSCGTKITCDENHLWTLETVNHHQKITITTREMSKKRFRRSAPWRLPFIEPIEFEKKNFPLEPYLLGALIGDGSFRNDSITFTTADKEILYAVNRLLPNGVGCNPIGNDGIQFRLSKKGFCSKKPNPLKTALRELKLLGHRSETKYIPEIYFWGSVIQRLELLRGLLDTDGTIDRNRGSVTFSSSSSQLVEDVKRLVFSLGGFAAIHKKPTKRLMSYVVSINISKELKIFGLTRKQILLEKQKGKRRVRRVISVVPSGWDKTTCIKVAAEDGLFLTTNCVPTHNSTWLMNILMENVLQKGKTVINFSAEMSMKRYADLTTAYLTRQNRDHLSDEHYKAAAEMMPAGKFYHGYKPGSKFKDVLKLLADAKQVYGGDIFVVDPIHFLIRGEQNESAAFATAMRELVDFSIKWNVIVIAVGQGRKSLAGKHGKMAVGQDARFSAALSEDAATTWILHRNRVNNPNSPDDEPVFEAMTRVKLDYSRNSNPMSTKLYFNGAIARFTIPAIQEMLS